MLREEVVSDTAQLEVEFCEVEVRLMAAICTYAKILRLSGVIVAIVESGNETLALSSDGEWRIKKGGKIRILPQPVELGDLVHHYALILKSGEVDSAELKAQYPEYLAEFIEVLKARHKDICSRA